MHSDARAADEVAPGAAPVAIGGIGGSGTRVVAGIVAIADFYTGGDLNPAGDNLWYTLLFKRREVLDRSESEFAALARIFARAMMGGPTLTAAEREIVFEAASTSRPQHDAAWLGRRAQSLIEACERPRPFLRWGWKEPNAHVVLDRLARCFPGLRYIHVMRNGLDMAFSDNQNQLEFWGGHYLRSNEFTLDARSSLRYWCAAHRKVLETGRSLGSRFLAVNFDRLCIEPERELDRITGFLAVPLPHEQRAAVLGMIRVPPTMGRFRRYGTGMFDAADIDYVRSLGYETA